MRFRIAAAVLLLRLFAAESALAESTPAPSTERTADTAVYAEGGGSSIFYSVNFDRRFHDFAGRIGVGYFYSPSGGTPSSTSLALLSVPVTISYLGGGSHTHMLELGLGVTLFVDKHTYEPPSGGSYSKVLVPPSVFIGYRRQPADGGFVLRTGLSLLVTPSLVGDKYFPTPVFPLPYLALGAAFE